VDIILSVVVDGPKSSGISGVVFCSNRAEIWGRSRSAAFVFPMQRSGRDARGPAKGSAAPPIDFAVLWTVRLTSLRSVYPLRLPASTADCFFILTLDLILKPLYDASLGQPIFFVPRERLPSWLNLDKNHVPFIDHQRTEFP
jgi:hypothetical protein